jgi:hypothetical protein
MQHNVNELLDWLESVNIPATDKKGYILWAVDGGEGIGVLAANIPILNPG